jgi:hypothetical protein
VITGRMNYRRLALSGTVIGAVALATHPAAQTAKVVFIRDGVLVSARADGSHVTELVRDDSPKHFARWSPSGDQIMYVTKGSRGDSASIVVVDQGGRRITTRRVLSLDSEDIATGGMRGVEEAGWADQHSVYALGSVNPRAAEYRRFSLVPGAAAASPDGGITYYEGTQFSTCSRGGAIAYIGRWGGLEGMLTIDLSPVTKAGADGWFVDQTVWSTNCERLLLREIDLGSGESRLLIVRNGSVESSLSMATSSSDGTRPRIYPLNDSFLFMSASAPLQYDPATRSLARAEAQAARIRTIVREREAVVERLGGQPGSADWWPSGF